MRRAAPQRRHQAEGGPVLLRNLSRAEAEHQLRLRDLHPLCLHADFRLCFRTKDREAPDGSSLHRLKRFLEPFPDRLRIAAAQRHDLNPGAPEQILPDRCHILPFE